MCGQFAILGSLKAVKEYYEFLKSGDFSFEDDYFDYFDEKLIQLPNLSITPKKYLPIITYIKDKVSIKSARWGLVPFWAKDDKQSFKTINARIETIHEKPSFKYAYQQRRCLIPMSGFYEKSPVKKEYYFPNENDKLQSFAGLYEIWGSDKLITFTVITCPADDRVINVHPRMPIVLNELEAINWIREGKVG